MITNFIAHLKVEILLISSLGWVSECFENGSPPDVNFPSPYGDPKGSGPDPSIQIDQINTHSGGDRRIEYLQWNTIQLHCVPNSICREGANYIGRRCQCFRNSTFDRKVGTCSFAPSINNSLPFVAINIVTILSLYYS